MKKLSELDKYRVQTPLLAGIDPDTCGYFLIQTTGRKFFVIASVEEHKPGLKVDHISISHRNENVLPTWDELCQIKDIFFDEEEECVQFFPKKSQYVNIRKNCLHIWRPHNGIIFGKPLDEKETADGTM